MFGVLQKSELETSLAIERAARAAVEKASASLSRSNASFSTPLQTPSRTGKKTGGAFRGSFIDLPSPLPEHATPDERGHRTEAQSYSSPNSVLSPSIVEGMRHDTARHQEVGAERGGYQYLGSSADIGTDMSGESALLNEPEQLLM